MRLKVSETDGHDDGCGWSVVVRTVSAAPWVDPSGVCRMDKDFSRCSYSCAVALATMLLYASFLHRSMSLQA